MALRATSEDENFNGLTKRGRREMTAQIIFETNWKKHSGKSLSQRERVARASGPGEGYRIY